jgi:hypothetical protein
MGVDNLPLLPVVVQEAEIKVRILAAGQVAVVVWCGVCLLITEDRVPSRREKDR